MTVKFNQMAGIIDKEDEQRFKRIVFRVTKGNAWLNVEDIDDNLLLGNERIVNVENVNTSQILFFLAKTNHQMCFSDCLPRRRNSRINKEKT